MKKIDIQTILDNIDYEFIKNLDFCKKYYIAYSGGGNCCINCPSEQSVDETRCPWNCSSDYLSEKFDHEVYLSPKDEIVCDEIDLLIKYEDLRKLKLFDILSKKKRDKKR